jgi:murein DD-endopeptidase MepM/ murein hydrolase activator NlpD
MFSERKFSIGHYKFRWIALISLLLAVFLFLAVNQKPQAEPQQLAIKTIEQDVLLPLPALNFDSDEQFQQIELVRQDDTLPKLFDRMNIRDNEAIKFLMLSPDAKALNTLLLPGHLIEAKSNLEGKLLHLEYELDSENILVAGLTPQGYQVATQKLLLEKKEALKSAVVTNSLFGATDDAGIPDQIALQIAEILSGEIDFYQDLRPGDHFNVVYEEFYNAGEMMKTGNILAIEFVNKGKIYQAIHFGESSGKYSYYTPEGKSLHKSFLRSPLEYTRISSSYNAGRYHPILQRIRAHKGVDMAAPSGTKIRASGEGVVDFMGVKGGYGNVIVLKHPGGISTVYGHMSGFASDLRKGTAVEQGDVIGFVGMTGLATGPHLHYEFLLNGEHRDPMTVALPTNIPIDETLQEAFARTSLNYMAKIGMLNMRTQVALEN